jgi:vacuolar-type H+-ATPase subunit I/STV1
MWAGSLAGPKIVPNNYQIRLIVDGKAVATETWTLKVDPRLDVTQDDLQKQFDFLNKVTSKISETHGTILEIRDLRKQFEDLSAKLKPEQKDLKDKSTEIVKNLTSIEEELVQNKIKSSQDALNYPIKLNNKLAGLNAIVGGSDYAPTNQSYDVYNDLTSKIDAQIAKFNAIKNNDIATFNKMYAEKNLPIIFTKLK